MAVSQNTPRRWSSAEIKLVTIVDEPMLGILERAKALRRWQASYEDYRAFIAISSEGIWRFEIEQPIPVTLPVDDQIDMLYQFAYLAECNNAMSRMYGYDSADQILGARLGDLVPSQSKEYRVPSGCCR
jgi:PAS domain-containing protein